MKQLALFVLNSFILPQGKMRLRVFEPRYIRLVAEASSGKRDFALAQINPYVSQHHPDRVLTLATRVLIEDFEQLDDGLLGITISGVEKVRIIKRWQEADNLQVAEIESVSAWLPEPPSDNSQPLAKQLKALFEQYPSLETLYDKPDYQDAAWVAARLLEILPMQPALKQQLALHSSAQPCIETLHAWLQQQN